MSEWISFVKLVQDELDCTYGEALHEASLRRRNSVDSARVSGEGPMWDSIKRHAKGIKIALRSNRRNIKPTSRKVLAKAGDKPIRRILIARAPLRESIGKIVSLANKLSLHSEPIPSRLFHLFFIITTDDEQYLMEKNQDINVIRAPNFAQTDTEIMQVDLPSNDLTINKMIENAIFMC